MLRVKGKQSVWSGLMKCLGNWVFFDTRWARVSSKAGFEDSEEDTECAKL